MNQIALELQTKAAPASLFQVMATFAGSDGEATKRLYAQLETHGPAGVVAVNLFRACKASQRAKVYRGGLHSHGSFKGMAYERKQWAMDNLVDALGAHGDELGLRWGWKEDPKQQLHKWVLYVDLPTGQVSFHAAARGAGLDYPGEWDGAKAQAGTRICRHITHLLGVPPASS